MGLLRNRRVGLSAASSTIMLLSLVAVPAGVSALPAPQEPVTEAFITAHQDGLETDDATSGPAVPGTDNDPDNGIVKNFDIVTYEVEVSLNDADDTNVIGTVVLNDKASWTGVPLECKTVAAGFTGVVPDSNVVDTNGDGLNDTLVCNLGDHVEGTKLSFKPTAQAVGNNTEIITAEVVPSSDNSDPAENRGDGLVETEITASFGVSLGKSIVSLPPEDEIEYSPVYEPASVHGREGTTVEWHIALGYGAASEFVEDDGTGVQSFTIEDTWVGTHSQTPSVEGDNDTGNFSDGIELRDLVTNDPADACSLIDAPAGTVTCTQPGGPGSPITIQIDDVLVNQQPIAKVSLKMFYPFDTVFPTGPWTAGQTYNIDNRVELIDWGGATALTTSATGAVDPGPEVAVNDYLVSASRPGSLGFYKVFDKVGNGKTGQRAAARGELIETGLQITAFYNYDREFAICDTIDTASFEFAGTDGILGWHTGYSAAYPALTDHNPSLVMRQRPNFTQYDREFDGSNFGLTLEFSDVDYATTSDDHWTATCEDDLTGDGNSDWVTDVADLPGGETSVIRVRLSWDYDYDVISAEPYFSEANVNTMNGVAGFFLRIKDTTTIGSYLPNAAATYAESSIWAGEWLHPTQGTNSGGSPTTSSYVNAETDPADDLYSFNITTADRVLVLPASMAIKKSNVPSDVGPLAAGDMAVFEIDPSTGGSNAAAVEMTFTDTLPAGLTYVSDNCDAAYMAVGLSCTTTVSGQTITFVVPGYQVGDDLPAFELTAVVDKGAAAGSYENRVTISSDFVTFTDDSHCDDAANANGDVDAASIAACRSIFRFPHSDNAFVQIVASAGESVSKGDVDTVLESQMNWVNTLTYQNLGGSDLGEGHLIDVLPFNGDGDLASVSPNSPERFNPASQNPANANTGTVTSDFDGMVEFVSVAASPAGETFEYTTTDSNLVDHRPCHPSNWAAGDLLGGGNALLDQICSEGLIDPGTDAPTPAQAGTGATDWSAAAGPTVTAFRALLPAFPSSGDARELTLTTNVDWAGEGDLLCNNFGLNSALVTLDIISNDVCVEIVAGSIGDTVWMDSNGNGLEDTGEPPIAGVTLELLDGLGNSVLDQLGNPITAVTDADGNYLFENLPSGNYQVMVDASTLPAGVSQTYDFDGPGDNLSETSLLGPAIDPDLTDVEDDMDQDFGYTSPYDLALTKALADGQASEVAVGEMVTYTINVLNQGTADVTDVQVTDYVPAGMTLSDSNWVLDSDGNASLVVPIPSISSGTQASVNISFTVDPDASGDVTNTAEVSEMFSSDGERVADVDSLADADPSNDIGPAVGGDLLDNVVDGSDGDEDDSDVATFSVLLSEPDPPSEEEEEEEPDEEEGGDEVGPDPSDGDDPDAGSDGEGNSDPSNDEGPAVGSDDDGAEPPNEIAFTGSTAIWLLGFSLTTLAVGLALLRRRRPASV